MTSNDIKRCFLSKERVGRLGEPLEKHHVMNGALRDFAEEEGLWVWLTPENHRWLHDTGMGVNVQKNLLKLIAQLKYEQTHSHEEWMKKVRKNYDDTV